jgi:hypothetical protein
MSCTPAFTGIFLPQDSQGWTINFLEWNSRYWLVAPAGKKESLLFEFAGLQMEKSATPKSYGSWQAFS